MNLFKKLIFAIVAIYFISPSISKAEVNTSKHFVILIHGIGGNKNTFGYLEKILNQGNLNLTAKTFEYRTGSLLTTYDFAKDLHDFITNLLKSEGSGSDKLSLIMHSQGGIVGYLWLKYIVENKIGYTKNLSSFITLSTPHWGADMAKIGKIFFYSLPENVENPLSPFGRKELNEMSFGSGTIHDMASTIDNLFRKIPHMRVLNVGGIKRISNSVLGEDDLVVPTYSMRSEIIYFKDEIKLFEKPREEFLQLNQSQSSERQFILVPADHIKLDQPGIADVPQECLNLKNCRHPTFPIILDQLKGTHVEQSHTLNLSHFRVTLFLKNAKINNDEAKDFSIKVEGLNHNIQIPIIERISSLRGSAELKDSVAFSFSGISKLPGNQKIWIILKYKNTTIQKYETTIKAGYSTLLDVQILRD